MQNPPKKTLYKSASQLLGEAIRNADTARTLQLLDERERWARSNIQSLLTQVDFLRRALSERTEGGATPEPLVPKKVEELFAVFNSTSAQIRDEVVRNEADSALRLLDEREKWARANIHRPVLEVDTLQRELAGRAGEEAIGEVQALFSRQRVRKLFARPDAPVDERLNKRVEVWTMNHNVDVNVEEGPGQYKLTYFCPTGGMLRASGKPYGRTRDPHPWSQGKKDVCYFCTHCTTAFELESIAEYGVPDWITERLENGLCSQTIYKRPEHIPQEIYQRIGMSKPAPAKK